MKTEEITINVDREMANVYRNASSGDRRKLDLLLNLKLTDLTSSKESLKEIMSKISNKAQKRGLTQDILRLMLNE